MKVLFVINKLITLEKYMKEQEKWKFKENESLIFPMELIFLKLYTYIHTYIQIYFQNKNCLKQG